MCVFHYAISPYYWKSHINISIIMIINKIESPSANYRTFHLIIFIFVNICYYFTHKRLNEF